MRVSWYHVIPRMKLSAVGQCPTTVRPSRGGFVRKSMSCPFTSDVVLQGPYHVTGFPARHVSRCLILLEAGPRIGKGWGECEGWSDY